MSCFWPAMHTLLTYNCPRFLHHLRTHTNDKIVLISNYTQTLDLFEKMCRTKKCKILPTTPSCHCINIRFSLTDMAVFALTEQ